MRKIFFLLSMIFSGFGVFAQPLVAPTLQDLPSSITTSSFLILVTDTNPSEMAIEVEVSGGGVTRSNVVPAGSSFNFHATSLVPKTGYQVRARALGCAAVAGCLNLGPWSTTYTITTLVAAPVAPILKLDNNCARFVGISWEMPARGDEVTNFTILRAFDGVSFQTVGNVPGGQRNLFDLGIAAGVPATYIVFAENSTGRTPSARLTVPVKAFVPPVPPINVKSSTVNKSDTQLNIVWENPEQDFACGTNIRSSYYVMIKREGETEFKVYDIIYPNASGIIIKGLKPNERVEYDIFSLSDKGLFSEHRIGVDNTYGPASKPTNFIGVAFKDAVNNSAIGLSWDHAPKDEDYFVIEASKDGINFMTLGKIKDGNNTFKHEPIEEGVDYIYRIKAGNYLFGESDYVTTQPIKYAYSAKPNAPYGLSGVISAAKVDLKWYDDSNKEENYILERSVDNNTSFVELKKLDRNTTRYTDNTVTAGKTYFYQVKAVNTLGSSAASNVFQAKIAGGAGLLNTEISIYPNPTLDFVTISNESLNTSESFEVSILDQNNMEVFKRTYGTKNVKINLEDYKTGVYNLIIKNPTETISRKIVKY
ncbi:T9SS type A sorting domain-containing protein [Lacihabitans soyangensis]|uniref:T9SS C-terminal target domain-containing protein n=1 Tax=Lacihabitans soyangensis TaxID=869394 RepID=A0AAE3H0J6_9BACT|nr:T9SS type A sorting domain-containing protein [Lacihabitans soyangensis]MCP9762739.1 T9SS C-terminal target domain-containing protein [Lacihabitans soyangensis]